MFSTNSDETSASRAVRDARGKHRVVEEQPGLVKNQQGWRAVEAFVEAREQITQHGQHRCLAMHQLFHLEALDGTRSQAIRIRVQQLAVRTTEYIGLQGLAQGV